MAAATLALLEERLQRLDYILHGDSLTIAPTSDSASATSATTQLQSLERRLDSLTARTPIAAEVLALHKAQPSLFHPSPAPASPTLPPAALTALVLAHTPLYNSLASSLSQLQTSPVPSPAGSAKLIDLQPRLERVQAKQEQQARELAELRLRSARVVETWYRNGVLEMGECWAGWEERIREAEILTRRKEAAEKREKGVV